MTTVYAIGDIHGHLGLLKAAHDLIEADRARHAAGPAPVVHLGDLIDRGPESAGVISYLDAGLREGRDWVVLKGNHDRMLRGFLQDPHRPDEGLRNLVSYLHPGIGGAATLASYGVHAPADRPVAKVHADALERVPPGHLAFIDRQRTHFRAGDLLFVHAGVRPGVALEKQTETDLVWIREPFLSHAAPHPWLVVHGHTTVDAPQHRGNRVNIDSGAAYGGPLTALVVEGSETFVLTPRGRAALRPPTD